MTHCHDHRVVMTKVTKSKGPAAAKVKTLT